MLGNNPVEQVGDLVANLLKYERLHDQAVDKSQVDEQLAESPALQLGALDLQCLGQRFGGDSAGGHQSDAEQWTAAGHGDGVHKPVAEPHDRLVASRICHGQSTGRLLGRMLKEKVFDFGRRVAVGHR